MKNKIQQVEKFQEAYNQPIATAPCFIPVDRFRLRFHLMEEENQEYLDACNHVDKHGEKITEKEALIEVADALGDMLYILCGTIIEHGMQNKIDEVFDEIQRSNMSKLGEDGQPVYRQSDQKVLKGPNYFPPNIKAILENSNVKTNEPGKNTVYEYGVMSSKFKLIADSKLTAYATMCIHYQRNAHMIAIYSPEECKEDSWMNPIGKVYERLDEIFGGKNSFDNYIEKNKEEIQECYLSIEKIVG